MLGRFLRRGSSASRGVDLRTLDRFMSPLMDRAAWDHRCPTCGMPWPGQPWHPGADSDGGVYWSRCPACPTLAVDAFTRHQQTGAIASLVSFLVVDRPTADDVAADFGSRPAWRPGQPSEMFAGYHPLVEDRDWDGRCWGCWARWREEWWVHEGETLPISYCHVCSFVSAVRWPERDRQTFDLVWWVGQARVSRKRRTDEAIELDLVRLGQIARADWTGVCPACDAPLRGDPWVGHPDLGPAADGERPQTWCEDCKWWAMGWTGDEALAYTDASDAAQLSLLEEVD